MTIEEIKQRRDRRKTGLVKYALSQPNAAGKVLMIGNVWVSLIDILEIDFLLSEIERLQPEPTQSGVVIPVDVANRLQTSIAHGIEFAWELKKDQHALAMTNAIFELQQCIVETENARLHSKAL